MPSQSIELSEILYSARLRGVDLLSFEETTFSLLRKGRIAAKAAEGTRSLTIKTQFASADVAAQAFGFLTRESRGLISLSQRNGYSHMFSRVGFITMEVSEGFIELITDAGEVTRTFYEEIEPYNWELSHFDRRLKLLLCEDISNMSRRTYKHVSLSRSDCLNEGLLLSNVKRKRTGPKGFADLETINRARALLIQQPEISRSFFEDTVRDWLGEKDLCPGKTAFHEHFGTLWTRHAESR